MQGFFFPALSIWTVVFIKKFILLAVVLATILGGYTLLKPETVEGRGVNTPINFNAIATSTVDEKIHLLAGKYKVREAVARAIIGCESHWNPDAVGYNRKSNGKVWSLDIGYFQLNDYYQASLLKSKHWDIYNPIDNLEAGFYILSTQGTSPWAWSKPCWGSKI